MGDCSMISRIGYTLRFIGLMIQPQDDGFREIVLGKRQE